MPKNIYIAVEIPSRELHAKVLLACIAAEKGYAAIIGNSAEMRDALRTWKPGTIVWKGLVKKAQKNYRLFHDFGHNVVAQCEEGLVYPSADFYTRLRVSEDALEELDLFFSWGGNQTKDILSKHPSQKEKIVLAGNPRIDLLDEKFCGVFDKEVEGIKKKYSPYFLVNTNFSSYTHAMGSEVVIQRLKDKGTIKTIEEEAFYRGRADNRKKLFHDFALMLESLATKFKDYTIVLRPHPSENIMLWKDSVSHMKNVVVIREGSAIPWVIGSVLMIHNDCTTAIEASILGKNVISYRPTANNPYESELAVSLGVSTETIDDLSAAINDMLSGSMAFESTISSAGYDNLKKYISSIDSELACDVIVKNIEKLTSRKQHERKGLLALVKMIARRQRYKMINHAKSRRENISKSDDKIRKNSRSLAQTDVNEIINELKIHSRRFNNLSVKPVRGTNTCFRISQKSLAGS